MRTAVTVIGPPGHRLCRADAVNAQFECPCLLVGQLEADAADFGGIEHLVRQLLAAPSAEEKILARWWFQRARNT